MAPNRDEHRGTAPQKDPSEGPGESGGGNGTAAADEGGPDGMTGGAADSATDADRDPRHGSWERLAPGVVRCRLPGWDATVGAVCGTSGVLVVDTGSSPREGAGVRGGLRELFGLPVTHAVLTHSHFDH